MRLCMAAKKSRKRKSASEHRSHPTQRHNRRATLSSRDKSRAKPRAKAAGRAQSNVADTARSKPATKRTGGSLGAVKHIGHWSFRFDAGHKFPRLVDGNGQTMRFSLTPKSWGDILPRTMAAARRIAAKGRRLFKRYRLQQA